MDLLRPPAETGGGADYRGLVLKGSTAGKLSVFEFLDAGEMLIDQRIIGKRPEVLGRLEFRGMGRQEQQVGAIRVPETASRQGMGSTPQGVTTCCPMSGAIPDP